LLSQGNIKGTVSSNIDDRALHEIYAWPFADMIHTGVGSVVCSYNQVNNSQACQNSYVLNVLKEQLGFPGFVMSDWSALHSGVASVLAGADMSMPGRKIGVPPESVAFLNLTIYGRIARLVPHIACRGGRLVFVVHSSIVCHCQPPDPPWLASLGSSYDCCSSLCLGFVCSELQSR
jgi:hypothetical protein